MRVEIIRCKLEKCEGDMLWTKTLDADKQREGTFFRRKRLNLIRFFRSEVKRMKRHRKHGNTDKWILIARIAGIVAVGLKIVYEVAQIWKINA